jgi:hypothetical protein
MPKIVSVVSSLMSRICVRRFLSGAKNRGRRILQSIPRLPLPPSVRIRFTFPALSRISVLSHFLHFKVASSGRRVSP